MEMGREDCHEKWMRTGGTPYDETETSILLLMSPCRFNPNLSTCSPQVWRLQFNPMPNGGQSNTSWVEHQYISVDDIHLNPSRIVVEIQIFTGNAAVNPSIAIFITVYLSSGLEGAIWSYGYPNSQQTFPMKWGPVWNYLEILRVSQPNDSIPHIFSPADDAWLVCSHRQLLQFSRRRSTASSKPKRRPNVRRFHGDVFGHGHIHGDFHCDRNYEI